VFETLKRALAVVLRGALQVSASISVRANRISRLNPSFSCAVVQPGRRGFIYTQRREGAIGD